ncbi:MAG: hypothetical protein J7501_14485 [Bdellovibrio sp.]|nr:hypothetical protein [Bdellovibrio sp.]
MTVSKIYSVLLASLMTAGVSSASAGNYCAAIRGNGELMPAHWGAMSSLVEDNGLPSAMAGGSSATITMFLLESLSQNPRVQTNSERALLIKSFQGYFETMTQTPEGKAIQALLADKNTFESLVASANRIDDVLGNPTAKELLVKNLSNLQTLMESQDLQEIINPDFVVYVQRTLILANQKNSKAQSIALYRSAQITHAIKNFGSFDSVTDKTLFVRPGLIDFKKLALIIGKMGNFYANYNNESAAGKQIEQRMKDFLQLCTPGSKDLTWRELTQAKPACAQLLGSAVLMYRESGAKGKSRVNENIGAYIPSFATTSVLSGAAVEKYVNLYKAYQMTTDLNFGDFSVAPNDLHFGYWGYSSDLAKIENQLRTAPEYRNDLKSQMFMSLGDSSWAKVLATSPAEPGLARIQAMPNNLLSAGGWSDLHPVLVLKAFGCDNVIYVTRKGEESAFAQGVFRRLTLADDNTMNQLYSTSNPNSSMMRSQQAATKIKCTDWNAFKVTENLTGLVAESMRAPLIDSPNCQ